MNVIEIPLLQTQDEKVTIIIDNKEYAISTHISMSESQKYVYDLSQKKDYKEAFASFTYNKLKFGNNNQCPTLEEIINTDDSFFTDYILKIVSNDEKLCNFFNDINPNLSIIKRFGIAYKIYANFETEKMVKALKPLINNLEKLPKNIDFSFAYKLQEYLNIMRPFWLETRENLFQSAQHILEAMQPWEQLANSYAKQLSIITIPNISEERLNQLKTNYQEWGRIGWSVLPNAPYNFFGKFPSDINTANKMAIKYCNKKSINELFNILRKQNVRTKDLESAIFCFENYQYKACAMMIFSLMDSKMIKNQSANKNRVVGLKAVKKLKIQLDEKTQDEQFMMLILYHFNLMTCLDTYFMHGDNFRKEPQIINRNYLDHGMNKREVRKRDCIQLFLALYNLLEFLDYIS